VIRKFQILGLLLCVLTSFQVIALDFLQTLKLAESNDPDFLAAQFNFQAITENRPQSLSALRPQLDLDIFTTHTQLKTENSSNANVLDGSSNYNTDGYSLSLTQSIYNHDLYLLLEQTDINIASGKAEMDAARQQLIIRVAEAYYDVLASGDNVKFARAEKKAIAQQLEQSQQRFDVGLIAITDVKEAQASYDISVAQEISANNQLSISQETLRSIINQPADQLNTLTHKIPLLSPEPADINQWEQISIKNNLSLKVANYVFEAAQKEVSIHRSQHYPSLDLSVRHNYSSPDGGNFIRDSTDTSVTLNLNIPIYSGGSTSSKTRQAIAEMEKQRALKNKAHRNTIKQSRDSYLGVTTSIAQVKAFKQALTSTQAALEATQAGFEVGTRTAVDVLAAVRELYRSEKDYAQARYNYILNLLRLKQAAGILSSDDTLQINKWLQH
jgi:outer membrane protein